MSTLLTPIITQIELDRDRFKDLVNGDETVTVSLENRTEKSISGQIKDRIDAMAISLTDAVNDAQTAQTAAETAKTASETAQSGAESAETNAFNYSTAAEGARDQVLSDKADIDAWRADIDTKYGEVLTKAGEVDTNATNVDNWTTQAQTYSQNAANSAADASQTLSDINDIANDFDGVTDEPLGVSPSINYPTNQTELDVTVDTWLVGSAPRPLGGAKFINREFTIEEWDAENSEWVFFFQQPLGTFSYLVSANTLDDTKQYRWKIEDTFSTVGEVSNRIYKTRQNDFVELRFTAATSPDVSYPFVGIDKPVATATANSSDHGIVVTGSSYTTTSTVDHNTTACVITNQETGKVVHVQSKTQNLDGDLDLETIEIDKRNLAPDVTYNVRIKYIGGSPESPHSQWSDAASVTTFAEYYNDSSLVSQLSNKRDKTNYVYTVESTVDIDHTVNKMVKIDRSTNPAITLTTPASEKYVQVFAYMEGTTGTPTYPSVTWGSGSEPVEGDLGSNWTLFSFRWIDSFWLGQIESTG